MCSELVRPDDEGIKSTEDSQYSSVRMFTAESYHRSFWSLLEHGVVLLDKEYTIIEANPYFVDLIGIPSAELIGRDVRDFIDNRFVHTDTTVMDAIIEGLDSSYFRTETIHKMDKRRTPIPVKIIVTRVPSQLMEDFQHFIVQVYKIEKAAHVGEQQYIRKVDQDWGDIFKSLFLQRWFITLIIILLIFITLTGNLLPFLEKLF